MVSVVEVREKFEIICLSNGLDTGILELLENTSENKKRILKVFFEFNQFLNKLQEIEKLDINLSCQRSYFKHIPLFKLAFDKENYSYCINQLESIIYLIKEIDGLFLYDLIYLFHETIETKDISDYQ